MVLIIVNFDYTTSILTINTEMMIHKIARKNRMSAVFSKILAPDLCLVLMARKDNAQLIERLKIAPTVKTSR